MKIEIMPFSFDADNEQSSAGRIINCFRQTSGSRSRKVLKSVPSTSAFSTTAIFQRALYATSSMIYSVAGSKLYAITADGTSTSVSAIADGDTTISANNGIIVISANGTYYTYDGLTLAANVSGPFTSIGSVDFLNQYTLYTEKDGRRHGWSDVADATTLPGLNFATAEGRDDNIIRGMVISGRWVLFKETSRETWYSTGGSGADAFKLIPNGIRDTGLKSYNLVVRVDENAFYVGDDNIVRLTDGFNDQVVSTPQVSEALQKYTPTNCLYYEASGHKHCVIRFSDRPALVFDMAEGEWHERAETADLDPWGAIDSVKFGNSWYVGTLLGKVQKLSQSNVDVAGALKRKIITPTITFPERATVSKIELYTRVGKSDLGRDAQVMMRLSRDGGETWTAEKWRSLGDLGDYNLGVRWRAQGQARQLNIEWSITDPAEIPVDAEFLLEV